jgi:transcriptional regulator with XRE-family HTH domain
MTNKEYLKQVGKRVKAARQKLHVNQADLADMCNLEISAISELERGLRNSRILTLKVIADNLRVDIREFL